MKIPKRFHIPTYFEFEIMTDCHVKIFPLSRLIASEDYSLIISNKKHLKGMFGELDNWWPSDDLSERENYEMLIWHEKQFKNRQSFAYAILLNDEYIGCFYIYGLDVVYKIVSVKDSNLLYVFMWISESNFYNGIDYLIFQHLKQWISNEWSFAKADYPGRVTPLVSFRKDTASWIKTTKDKE